MSATTAPASFLGPGPATSPPQDVPERRQYVAAVLTCYIQLPHTPNRSSRNDRRLAHRLFDQKVPLDTVKAAFLLAVSRRTFRPKGAPPLEPIRSLAYFLPVIKELEHTPPDATFISLIRHRLLTGFPHLGVPPLSPPIPW
jgi:hypothetical protein